MMKMNFIQLLSCGFIWIFVLVLLLTFLGVPLEYSGISWNLEYLWGK